MSSNVAGKSEDFLAFTSEAWSQNPNFLTVMMSRRGFPVRGFRRGDPGKMGKQAIFFSDGNMSVSFSYPKKVSESVSYFIYGDNHYQIWIKLVILEHPTFSDPDWEHRAVIHREIQPPCDRCVVFVLSSGIFNMLLMQNVVSSSSIYQMKPGDSLSMRDRKVFRDFRGDWLLNR